MSNILTNIDKRMNDVRYTVPTKNWHDCLTDERFVIHGLPFFRENHNFSRLKSSISINNSLDTLSKHPSGAFASFYTDSSTINLEVDIASKAYMSHMSACGQCGLDLYYFDEGLNQFVFIGTTKINEPTYRLTLISGLPTKKRLYRLYFPLYIGLNSVKVGIDDGASIYEGEPICDNTIVFYGTSICQGGCATRPGMSSTSIIGRSIIPEVINLGFSGSAMLETEVALQIAEIKNIKYLIIEAEANAGECDKLEKNLEAFLNIVSKAADSIILLTHYPSPFALLKADVKAKYKRNLAFQSNVATKYNNVVVINGYDILKHLNFEETVDTVHLTDLGFFALAKYFEDYFRKECPDILRK